jgi:hypothetical protein
VNVPSDLAHKVVEQMKATPFVLAILIVNITVLAGFAFTLHQISSAMARRDNIIERCIK